MAGWEGLTSGLGVTPCYIRSRLAHAAPSPPSRQSANPYPGEYAAHQFRGLLPDSAAEPALAGRLDGPGAGARAERSTGAGGWRHARAQRPGASGRARELGGTPTLPDGGSNGGYLPRAVCASWRQGLVMGRAPAGDPRQGSGATVGAAPDLGGPATDPPAQRWDADGLGADAARDVESCAGCAAGNCRGRIPTASPGRTWRQADPDAGDPEHGGFSRGLVGGSVGLRPGPGSEFEPVLWGFSLGLASGSNGGGPAGAASPAR